jgi:phytoene/squalene synthetase
LLIFVVDRYDNRDDCAPFAGFIMKMKMTRDWDGTSALACSITRSASLQTALTIRLLADRERIADAYRAYAYFRWVDDWLDREAAQKAERAAFISRQTSIIERSYAGVGMPDACAEEQILIDLIRGKALTNSGLSAYVRNLMAVMAFDAERRGRLISQVELNAYQRSLAVGVTEALYYFIGQDQASSRTGARYLAATAAHITHMLRDTYDDLQVGYFNVPAEFLSEHGISSEDVGSAPYRAWVQSRVELARRCFRAGREYLAQDRSHRRRLAGFAYAARFESVLDLIERDGYVLRPGYAACKTPAAGLRMAWSVLLSALGTWHLQGMSRAVGAR